MKPVLLPLAALATAFSVSTAFAGNFPADRGFDDLKSYQTQTASVQTERTDAAKTRYTGKDSLSESARKFGSPERNFESGRN